MEVKSPTTFDKQVNLLTSKNIIIDDKQKCKDFLEKVNYYRFSAYYLPFYDKSKKECFDNTTFEKLENIYYFDQKLRAIIFSIIEGIEIHLRTQIAYCLAHKYDSLGYLSEDMYNSKHKHDDFLNRINTCIRENRNTLVVKHHKDKYDGNFPLWVIIEFFPIGMLSHFYLSLKASDQKVIAHALYDTSHKNLLSWLRCLTDLRNKCAHYSRLYYWIFPATPKMPKNEQYKPTRRLFAQIYMLKFMYPNKEKWNTVYLKAFKTIIDEYQADISLKHIDFPDNWESMLTLK